MHSRFDPDVLHGLVLEMLEWANAQSPPADVADRYAHLLGLVEARYPNLIQWPTRWYFDRSAGFLQAIAILYVSFSEYMAITGTPVAQAGGSGPFIGDIYDWVVKGEIVSFEAGEFACEPTREGELDFLPRGAMKAAAITDHYWAFEYGRGFVPGLWPSTIAGAFFMDLDFGDLIAMLRTGLDIQLRNLLHPGAPEGVTGEQWSNRPGNVTAHPERFFTPATLGDAVDIVDEAGRAGARVRVAGGGGACSSMVATDQWLLSTQRMAACTEVDTRSDPPAISVQGGTRLRDVTARARRHGLVLTAPFLCPDATVGGVLAAGAHGGGVRTGGLADALHDVTLLRGDGEVHTITRGDASVADDLRAAGASLGALGMVGAATLECERRYAVSVVDENVPIARLVDELTERAAAADGLDVVWPAGASLAWVRSVTRTTAPPDVGGVARTTRDAAHSLRGWLLGGWVHSSVTGAAPLGGRALTRLATRFPRRRTAVEWVDQVVPVEHLLPGGVATAFAVPATAADGALRAATGALTGAGSSVDDLLLQVRFVGASTALLSPTRGKDACLLTLVDARGHAERPVAFGAFAQALAPFDPAPAWDGVVHDPVARRTAYAAALTTFAAVRDRYDPDGRFLNEFVEQLVPHDVIDLTDTAPDAPTVRHPVRE